MCIDENTLKEMYQKRLDEEKIKRDKDKNEIEQVNENIELISAKIQITTEKIEKLNSDEARVKELIEERNSYKIFTKIIGILLLLVVTLLSAVVLKDFKAIANALTLSPKYFVLLIAGGEVSFLMMSSLLKSRKQIEKELDKYPSLKKIIEEKNKNIEQNTINHAKLKNLEVEKRSLDAILNEQEYLVAALEGKIELLVELTDEATKEEKPLIRTRGKN